MINAEIFVGILCCYLHDSIIRDVDGPYYTNDHDGAENWSALMELYNAEIHLNSGAFRPESAKELIFVDVTAEFTR